MLDSPAYRGLSAYAQAAYPQVARWYTGSNNGLIALSVRALADRLNCSKDTASRALIELEDAGFIATETIGAFSLKNRKASTYRLTMFRDDRNGNLPTKDFLHIPPQSGRKDRTVRQEGQTKQKYLSQSDQKDRQGQNGTIDSPATGTLIESNHRATRLDGPPSLETIKLSVSPELAATIHEHRIARPRALNGAVGVARVRR